MLYSPLLAGEASLIDDSGTGAPRQWWDPIPVIGRAVSSKSKKSSKWIEQIRFSGIFVIGLALIAIGFAVDSVSSGIDDWIDHLNASTVQVMATQAPPASQAPSTGAMRSARERGRKYHLPPAEMFSAFFKELGVAFVVAAIVGMLVEVKAKEHDAERSEQLRLDVAKDATFALFGLFHDPDFVRAVIRCNLMAEVVRTDMTQTYRLRNLTDEEAATVNPKSPVDAKKRFVMLDMEQHFTFKNVSSGTVIHRVGLGVARRSGVGASAVTKANFVRLGDKPALSAEEIEASVDVDQSNETYLHYTWERELRPQDRLSVDANVQCLKERSDNEVWASFFPTMGEVKLNLVVMPDMAFGLRPVTNGESEEIDAVPFPGRLSKSWVLKGPLLRHNSAVFWWRTQEDDGITKGGDNAQTVDVSGTVGPKRTRRAPTSSPKRGRKNGGVMA